MVMNMINYRTTSVPASMGIFVGVPKLMAITSYTVFVDFWKFGPLAWPTFLNERWVSEYISISQQPGYSGTTTCKQPL